MARLLDAGLSATALLQQLAAASSGRAEQRLHAALAAAFASGDGFAVAMRRAGPSVCPPHHAALIAAGESSGTLPRVLHRLATEDEHDLHALHDLLQRALYPLLLFHLAMLAPAVPAIVSGSSGVALSCVATMLVVDGVLAGGFWMVSVMHERATIAALLLHVPGLGRMLRLRACRRYLFTLDQLYTAGVDLDRAAEEALTALQNVELRRQAKAVIAAHEPGAAWAGAFARLPGLPRELGALLATAEPAGELGRALAQVDALLEDREAAARRRVTSTAGTLLYAAAALFVAVQVLSFYSRYFARF